MARYINCWQCLLLGFIFTIVTAFVNGQEKVCIPESIKNKKVSGTIYLSDGDTISGEFIHLTPENNIRTTHIIYKSPDGKREINRIRVISYSNEKEKEKRYKVYAVKDSVLVKKGCRYDMGVFMPAIVDGPYKLLKNELKSDATIQAYSQSSTNNVYFLLTPQNKLIKLARNDLKPQVQSIFYGYEGTEHFFLEPDFNIDTAAALIRKVNASILQE